MKQRRLSRLGVDMAQVRIGFPPAMHRHGGDRRSGKRTCAMSLSGGAPGLFFVTTKTFFFRDTWLEKGLVGVSKKIVLG